jgi:hypothetical protein
MARAATSGRYSLMASRGLFDIVKKDCGHAHASAGATWRVLTSRFVGWVERALLKRARYPSSPPRHPD